MNGGTYSRAKDAGFNDEQARFFADLGADTRQEAVKEIYSRQLEEGKKRKEAVVNAASTVLKYTIVFMAGVACTTLMTP